jgi:hypothetical protein
MQLTTAEAQAALREIEASRLAFRRAIRANRGYQYLWLWGVIWIGLALGAIYAPRHEGLIAPVLSGAGTLASFALGWRKSRQVRSPVDRRFLGALGVVLIFGLFVWPTLLGGFHDARALCAYACLLPMQCYIMAGIWFDNHLLWVGLLVSALLLVGFFWFLPIFYWWVAVFGGGTLIGSGFYVRHSWR